MKSLEKETKFVSVGKQQGIKGYIKKLGYYFILGIKPDENVSTNNLLVYSPKYLGRNN
ncbi:hypothetical protein M0R72_03065 [Candidatus Pacearchaeota archaeon]|jgi:hypothetical protein|nr:hypothetical protein [Candidatus Pacearchaeota archaeon]